MLHTVMLAAYQWIFRNVSYAVRIHYAAVDKNLVNMTVGSLSKNRSLGLFIISIFNF